MAGILNIRKLLKIQLAASYHYHLILKHLTNPLGTSWLPATQFFNMSADINLTIGIELEFMLIWHLDQVPPISDARASLFGDTRLKDGFFALYDKLSSRLPEVPFNPIGTASRLHYDRW